MKVEKKCSKCKQIKNVIEYHKNRTRHDGLDNTCKQCWKEIRQSTEFKAYVKKYKDENKERLREAHKTHKLRYKMKKFNSHFDEYKNTLKNQNNACAICKIETNELVIDHDHSTNEFRGLLCVKCNLMIGYANDDILILSNAIDYVKLHKNFYIEKHLAENI